MFQERHRIDVDCRRTDRTQPLFSTAQPSDCPDLDDEKERQRRYSAISPNISDIGAQAPSNDHIEQLAGILLTYNFYEKDLGAHFHLCHVGVRNDVWCLVVLTRKRRLRPGYVGSVRPCVRRHGI
jgi:hypothetical protein